MEFIIRTIIVSVIVLIAVSLIDSAMVMAAIAFVVALDTRMRDAP